VGELRVARQHGIAAVLSNDGRQAIGVLRSALNQLDSSRPSSRSFGLVELAAAHLRLPSPELEEACESLGEAYEIASRQGIGEVANRVVEVRDQMQLWATAPSVRQLDERLGLVR
jgi:hypothetical protein